MKKLLNVTFAVVLTVLSLGITSCNKPTDNPGIQPVKVIDFRNKNPDGSVLSGRAALSDPIVNPEFKYEFLDDIEKFDKHSFYKVTKEINGNIYTNEVDVESSGNGSESKEKLEAFAGNVKVVNHKDGIKVEFTAPTGFAKLDFWGLSYVDGNGNDSTGIEKDNAIDENGKLSVIYPLVIKGKPATIKVHLGSLNIENTKHWEAQLYFSVTPVNGLGCVDDMPKDYDSSDYLDIEEGHILKVSKMIPPMAQNLKRSFLLNEQDKGTIPYGVEGDYAQVNGLGFVWDENASEKETDASDAGESIEFTIDLKEYVEYSDAYEGRLGYHDNGSKGNQPYIWAMFKWSYTLEKFPGYTFLTPNLFSKVVANTEFLEEVE